MKNKKILLICCPILFIGVLFLMLPSCKKAVIPTINTLTVTEIAGVSAVSGGEIIDDGGGDVTERGVCWSSMGVPTISDTKTSDGVGSGKFTSTIEGLTPGTAYQVRAYAVNEAGVAYGNVMTFITKFVPTAITDPVTEITKISAKSGGTVASVDDSPITARGICWSVNASPTITDFKTTNGTGSGDYDSWMSSLSPGTTYNVRAYATNQYGTGYGMSVTFTTLPGEVPVLTTVDANSITAVSAISGGNITSDGGTAITGRGIIWGSSQYINLTNATGYTSNGTGTGSFTSDITGLEEATTYYVRAYATNSTGTGYGTADAFTTLHNVVVPTVSASTITGVSDVSAVDKFSITSSGYGTVTEKGVCWSTSPNPTIEGSHLATTTSDYTSTPNYFATITGLTPSTTYYVRSYAKNSAGAGYGESTTITTREAFSCGDIIIDASDKTYNTIQVGTQCWMKESLKTTRYNNGRNIEYFGSGYPPYFGMIEDSWWNLDTYGGLYQWYAVGEGTLCPNGWHVPSETEWATLITLAGGPTTGGNKLKQSGTGYWCSDNTGTNELGLSIRKGGYIMYYYSTWDYTYHRSDENFNLNSYFWTSTNADTDNAEGIKLNCSNGNITNSYTSSKNSGFSVRCIKD